MKNWKSHTFQRKLCNFPYSKDTKLQSTSDGPDPAPTEISGSWMSPPVHRKWIEINETTYGSRVIYVFSGC